MHYPLLVALALPCMMQAAPRHENTRPAQPVFKTQLSLKKIVPAAEQQLNILGAELRELIGHSLNNHCYVGFSSVKSWRPMQNYGDTDAKLRVYNPRLGVALRYRF